jgi:hypothetical protein
MHVQACSLQVPTCLNFLHKLTEKPEPVRRCPKSPLEPEAAKKV